MSAHDGATAGALRLEVRGAAFGYAGRPVVRDVELGLRAGRFHGIVGANGSGKTTLLRGLLGLLPPLGGTVRRAESRAGGPARARYVPQREALEASFPLRVSEVVEMGTFDELGLLGGLPARARRAAHEALDGVGLAEKLHAPFGALSGGQRQRVLLARALAGEPDLLFLDEPTSGVDEEASAAILALLAQVTRERGMVTVLVSHQRELLDTFADEILLVRGGRVSPAHLAGEAPR